MRNAKMILLVLLLNLLVIGTCQGYAASPALRGIFEVVWGPKLYQTAGLKFAYIDGITLYIAWNEVEPEEGQYRWEVIDEALKRAQAENKILNIGVFPNFRAPKFVFDAGVATFDHTKWAQHDGVRTVVKAPLPWDPVYIAKWKDIIKALAKRYDGENKLGYIALTGPNLQAVEMSINLQDEDDLSKFKAAGFSNETLIKAWKEVIDCYEQNFKTAKSALIMGLVQKDIFPAQEIARYAAQKLGNRFVVKIAFLNGKWFQTMKPKNPNYQLIELLKSYSGTHDMGMEMFWKSAFEGGKENGPLDVAIQNGIKNRAKFVEIYRDDIEEDGKPNASFERILKEYHSRF